MNCMDNFMHQRLAAVLNVTRVSLIGSYVGPSNPLPSGTGLSPLPVVLVTLKPSFLISVCGFIGTSFGLLFGAHVCQPIPPTTKSKPCSILFSRIVYRSVDNHIAMASVHCGETQCDARRASLPWRRRVGTDKPVSWDTLLAVQLTSLYLIFCIQGDVASGVIVTSDMPREIGCGSRRFC